MVTQKYFRFISQHDYEQYCLKILKLIIHIIIINSCTIIKHNNVSVSKAICNKGKTNYWITLKKKKHKDYININYATLIDAMYMVFTMRVRFSCLNILFLQKTDTVVSWKSKKYSKKILLGRLLSAEIDWSALSAY